MNPLHEHLQTLTRRHFFRRGGLGLGTAALAALLPAGGRASQDRLPHHAPRAKRAIFLFMNGGPSQMDLWDHKPRLANWYDKELPPSIRKGQRLTMMTSHQ